MFLYTIKPIIFSKLNNSKSTLKPNLSYDVIRCFVWFTLSIIWTYSLINTFTLKPQLRPRRNRWLVCAGQRAAIDTRHGQVMWAGLSSKGRQWWAGLTSKGHERWAGLTSKNQTNEVQEYRRWLTGHEWFMSFLIASRTVSLVDMRWEGYIFVWLCIGH